MFQFDVAKVSTVIAILVTWQHIFVLGHLNYKKSVILSAMYFGLRMKPHPTRTLEKDQHICISMFQLTRGVTQK